MATTYYKIGPAIDAVLYNPREIQDFEGTLPELQITANCGLRCEVNLPALELDISLDDKLWSGEILPIQGEGLTLPNLKSTGQFGERLSTGTSANLPLMTCESNMGARLEEFPPVNLPAPTASATMTGEQLATLVKTLPSLSLEGRSGARAGSLTLPDLELSAGLGTGVTGSLSKSLTFPSISTEISSDDWGGTLSKALTFPSLSASGSETPVMTVSATLPGFRITATALSGYVGSLTETLPDLRITASATAEEFGSMSADLPTLTMRQVASGDVYGGSGEGTLTNRSRFDDYILRYSRW